MKETFSDQKPEFENTPDVPRDAPAEQFIASLPDDPEERRKYERVQIGTGDTALVAWRLKPERPPVGQEKLPFASHNDMERGYRDKMITSGEIVATTGSQLEEMLLDLEDRKATGETGLIGAVSEIKQALKFLNSDAIKPGNERSSIGKMSDEITRLRTRSEQMDPQQQKAQREQLEQKIRGYELALGIMQETNKSVIGEWTRETKGVVAATGKDITEQQDAVIMAQAIQGHIDRHNERVRRNTERRANRHPKTPEASPTAASTYERQATAHVDTRQQAPVDHERPEQKVFSEVLTAAKGNVLIHTDMPSGVELRYGSGKENFGGKGFHNFGSSELAKNFRAGKGLANIDVSEAVQFASATIEPVYEEGVNKKRFGKDEPYKILRGHQEVPLPEVMNQQTGKSEPGVAFRYTFYPKDAYGVPYPTNSLRPGNMLLVETVLPQSVAAQLEQVIRQDPKMAREIVRQLVETEGGVPEDVWNGTRATAYDQNRTVAAMRPPYDNLPSDWTIGLYGNQAMKGSPYTSLRP